MGTNAVQRLGGPVVGGSAPSQPSHGVRHHLGRVHEQGEDALGVEREVEEVRWSSWTRPLPHIGEIRCVEEPIEPLRRREDVAGSIDDQAGEGLVPVEEETERVTGLGEAGVVPSHGRPGSREPGRDEQAVRSGVVEVERSEELGERDPARLGPPGLEEAHVALRHPGSETELQLREATSPSLAREQLPERRVHLSTMTRR